VCGWRSRGKQKERLPCGDVSRFSRFVSTSECLARDSETTQCAHDTFIYIFYLESRYIFTDTLLTQLPQLFQCTQRSSFELIREGARNGCALTCLFGRQNSRCTNWRCVCFTPKLLAPWRAPIRIQYTSSYELVVVSCKLL
jgi:hypothetical protein